MSSPALGWQKLQDVYYRSRTCYDLNWDINLSEYQVRSSPNVTLIAILPRNLILSSQNSYTLSLYTGSGILITSIVHNLNKGSIVEFGFHKENLVLVLNNGKIRYYRDLNGGFDEYDYLGNAFQLHEKNSHTEVEVSVDSTESEEYIQVLDAKIKENFLILRLFNKFIAVNLLNFKNAEIPFSLTISDFIKTWEILPLNSTEFQLLISLNKTIVAISCDLNLALYEKEDKLLTEGPFQFIACSPNNEFISLFSESSKKLFIVSKSFDSNLSEFDSTDFPDPKQCQWCGNDAVIVSYQDEIKLVGPSGDSISFYYDSESNDTDAPLIQSAIDGIKILTNTKLEFLSRVSDLTVNTFRIGSTFPSAILLDSIEKLAQYSPKADSNIALLTSNDQLVEAVNDCLLASTEEFDSSWQKKLLKASSFGKASIEFFNSDEFVEIANQLRVLNQFRASDLGIFITYKQFLSIGYDQLIQMLLIRNLHYLALSIATFLKFENLKEDIYVNWCCSKIKRSAEASDTELFNVILQKLKSFNNAESTFKNCISIERISSIAYQEGRMNLCKLLIDHEPNVIKKINLYLNLEEDELALIKSFNVGDFDLCNLILLILQDKLTISHFFKLLNQNEKLENIESEIEPNLKVNGDIIGNFWVQNIGRFNSRLMKKFYLQQDNKKALSQLEFERNLKRVTTNHDENYELTKTSIEKFIVDKIDNKEDLKLLQDEMRLLNLKKTLTETYEHDFYQYQSIIEVAKRLISMNQLSKSNKIAKEFKVNDQKYWYLILNTFSKSKQFDKLYDFVSNSSKSPIGYQPFVYKCLQHKEKRYASLYIDMCNISYSEKIEMYILNNDLKNAATEAYRNKDFQYLDSIYDKGGNDVQNLIKQYNERLGRV